MPKFRGITRWGAITSVVLLSSLLLAACGSNATILEPAGPVASQEANLFWFVLWVATFIFVAVEAALIYSIIRYRARPNTPEPRQLHGNNTLEIMWTVAPALFLFAVLAGTIYTMFGLQQPTGNHLEVQAIGHQWWWEFRYPNQNITTADSLYVPKDTVVQVDLVSNNVIHSFWIPALTGKTDDIPGHNNIKWFKADRAGTYIGECAEYCGTQHAHMEFNVVVFNSGDEFNTWVSTQQQAAQTSTDALAAQGAKLFAGAGGCTACHGIVGLNIKDWSATTTTSGLPVSSLVGPNLTHFGGRSLIAGGVLSANDNLDHPDYTWANTPACSVASGHIANKAQCGLYQWLHDPQGVKPGNDMNIGALSDTQIDQLAAYLESLK
ncbi:MAG: cytochrome c oxidase subunit II [Ktedonobacteraceae bacterium]